MWVPKSLDRIILALKKLPGIGERSAERITFHLLREPEHLEELIGALVDARDHLRFCSICHGITDTDPCPLCTDPGRDDSVICVVERPQDVFLIERMGLFHGRYHVLGGVISPIDGVGPEALHIEDLVQRVRHNGVQEVILALNPTVEGDATAYYLGELLKATGVKVTRIARGLPAGSDLFFSDALTLREALTGRKELD